MSGWKFMKQYRAFVNSCSNKFIFDLVLKKLKVGINARMLIKNKLEGIGWFTCEVSKRLAINHPEVDFVFYFDRSYAPEYKFAKNVKPIVLWPQARHPILNKIWFDRNVKKSLIQEKVDVFFSPEGEIPLTTEVPCINVIHDINFVHDPNRIKWTHRKYFLEKFPKFAEKAHKIITVSNFSKQDLLKHYQTPDEKVVVAYNGVDNKFKKLSSDQKSEVRTKYANGKPYVLFIGALSPRKNIVNMLLAFDAYKKSQPSDQVFVIAGSKMYWTPEMEATLKDLEFKGEIIFLDRVEESVLIELYGSAEALLFVPFLEGFGLPIVEAFMSELPVITSNITAMPEVAGDAASLVDPNDVNEISQALAKVLSDHVLRSQMIAKGKKRAALFSWDHTADIVWQQIKEVYEQTR